MKKLITYAGCMLIALASGTTMAKGGGSGNGGSGDGGMGGASTYSSAYQENSENAIYGESKKFKHQNQHEYRYKEEKETDEDRAAKNNHSYGSNK